MSPRKAARRLLPLLEKHMDPFVKEAAKVASCRRGCSHCCHNLVGTSLAEGVLVASRLVEDPELSKDMPAIKATLQGQLKFILGLDATKSFAYMAAKKPCAFLDQKSGDCRVYDHRPVACRTYFVVSPPEQCSPDLAGGEVHFIDFYPTVKKLLPELLTETARIPPVTGAMQAMVLLGLEMLTLPSGEFEALLAQSSPGM